MGNLLTYNEQKLEEMPTFAKRKNPDKWYDSYGDDYPYKKVDHFLHSRVGKCWDDVVSEFVHKDWIPPRYRLPSKISEKVEVNTFIQNGKVCFNDNFSWSYQGMRERQIEEEIRETFYVHPLTKLLCLFKPKRVNYKKQREIEEAKTIRILGDYHQLVKDNGIWFEVKGKPVEPDEVVIKGLHYKVQNRFPITSTPIYKDIYKDKPEYKVVDGKLLLPIIGDWRYRGNRIGPKDRMIKPERQKSFGRYGFNHDSIKITMNRQLSSKELKKYGVTNDLPKTIKHRCDVCGGFGCTLTHNSRCPVCGSRQPWCHPEARKQTPINKLRNKI